MNEEALPQKADCWICFNNEKLTVVTTEKLLKQIVTYLDTSIVIQSFENDPPAVSCSSNCYESAHQLTLIEEQIEQLQMKISDSSLLFSQDVLERRRQFKNEDDESTNKLDPPNYKCSTIQKNQDCLPVIIGNVEVKKEIIDCVLNEFPSESQKQTGRDNIVKEAWFPDDEFENVTKNNCQIDNHSEEDLDVKYSYDEIVCHVDEVIAPNPTISAKNRHSNHKMITTPMADLLKCLKMPIIKLHRLQSWGSRNSSNIVATDKRCDVESKINDRDKYSRSSMNDNYQKNENLSPADAAELFNNPEDGPVYNAQVHKKSDVDKDEVPKIKKGLNADKLYKCCVCRNVFIKLRDLEDHKKLHSNRTCYFCQKSYTKPSTLKVHLRSHTGERPFTCSICSKGFVSSSKLKKHEKIHSGEKPYACSICEKSFPTTDRLKIHKTIHSGKKPYECDVCKKRFREARSLRSHAKIHTGEKPYKCRICETAFKRASHLKEHEKIHSGEKLYKCRICETAFKRVSHLKEHEKLHSGKKLHKCSNTLEKHKMIHSGERPYKCSFCENSCLTSSALKIHERIHTNEWQMNGSK